MSDELKESDLRFVFIFQLIQFYLIHKFLFLSLGEKKKTQQNKPRQIRPRSGNSVFELRVWICYHCLGRNLGSMSFILLESWHLYILYHLTDITKLWF